MLGLHTAFSGVQIIVCGCHCDMRACIWLGNVCMEWCGVVGSCIKVTGGVEAAVGERREGTH